MDMKYRLLGETKTESSEEGLLELRDCHLHQLIQMADVIFSSIKTTEGMDVIVAIDEGTLFLLDEVMHNGCGEGVH